MTLQTFINDFWDDSVMPELKRYVEIPCKSPAFDPDWEQNGYIQQAMDLLSNWAKNQGIQGMTLGIHRIENRTPLLYLEISGQTQEATLEAFQVSGKAPAQTSSAAYGLYVSSGASGQHSQNLKGKECILMYGHMDKQPEMAGWHEDLSPWKAVIKDGKLYGRGGADDGYALFSALTAIKALQQAGTPHARCVILIEASEESGSTDLMLHIDALKGKIGEPDLIICLDSGAENYDQLWCTSSLRGVINLVLRVDVLTEGVHSGAASGVVPSSFRILRQLLDRVEDSTTGKVLVKELISDIPEQFILEATQNAEVMGDAIWQKYPWADGTQPVNDSVEEMILNRNWRSTLCVTGVEGLPAISNAGNVLRPATALKLSFRVPPNCDAKSASIALKKILEADSPYGAKVTVDIQEYADGWHANERPQWLSDAIQKASQQTFGLPAMYTGEGGSIPFVKMLGEMFPKTHYMVTGVLGPHSNAHGPNEFLDIAMVKKVTGCVAAFIAAHATSNHGNL